MHSWSLQPTTNHAFDFNNHHIGPPSYGNSYKEKCMQQEKQHSHTQASYINMKPHQSASSSTPPPKPSPTTLRTLHSQNHDHTHRQCHLHQKNDTTYLLTSTPLKTNPETGTTNKGHLHAHLHPHQLTSHCQNTFAPAAQATAALAAAHDSICSLQLPLPHTP